jgi:hypothetical protein
MSRVLGILAGLAVVCSLVVMATNANAQVEPGPWKPDNPTFTVQQKGCGQVSDLTFKLTCSDGSGEQRAERRYATYSSGTHQFEGYFKITSIGGSRICLSRPSIRVPSSCSPSSRGGRLYSVHGGGTIATGATVGTKVRVNTVHEVGNSLKVYINSSLKQTTPSPTGSFYDKFGAYRTASGNGPITVEWSNVRFWQK